MSGPTLLRYRVQSNPESRKDSRARPDQAVRRAPHRRLAMPPLKPDGTERRQARNEDRAGRVWQPMVPGGTDA